MGLFQKLRAKIFPPHFSLLHWIGRDFVSPKTKMKKVIREVLSELPEISAIMDFGSGTLVWADYFVKEYGCPVYAVDTYYSVFTPEQRKNIVYYTDFKTCCDDRSGAGFSCVWACDVFHHIPHDVFEDFMKTIVRYTDTILIKDNDSNHRLGFFMNRMHDRIINGEKIYDVYPDKIARFLQSEGFETQYYYMPKLWFPHFMLAAKRRREKGDEA